MDTICLGAADADIARAADILRGGGIVAFPTDTVYGIGAHAYLPAAVEQLYVAKGRPEVKAIPLLISGLEALPDVAADIPDEAYALAARFWPGALSLVLRRAAGVPDVVTAGGDTVAVRVPDHSVTQALIAALGAPLAATSANRSEQPAPATANGVWAQLAGRIHLILDGGTCPGGMASTVVDLTVSPARILRQGGISADELAALFPLAGPLTGNGL
jgi:L-threonylcarbamoyladenylate synthase